MELPIWPQWPLHFDAALRFAAALLLTACAGELARRRAGLPAVSGQMLAGLVLGPLLLGWLTADDLAAYRVVLDFALALLLFELGIRLDLRWFVANPWMLACSVAEAAFSFVLAFAALFALGVAPGVALAVAAVAVGTSPAVVMRVTAELRATGQVTERLLALCALNVAWSVILFKLVAGYVHGAAPEGWLASVLHPLYLVVGSLLVGVLVAAAFVLLRRGFDLGSEAGVVAIFGLLLAMLAVLAALRLPAILAPLAAGLAIKWYDPRPQRWPAHFGSAGGVLVIALFMFAGVTMNASELLAGLPAALAAIAARVVGKVGGVAAFGPASGLSLRQSLALGGALLPLSAVALLLLEDARQLYPAFAAELAPVVLAMVALLGVLGPIVTQRTLIGVRENRSGDSP